MMKNIVNFLFICLLYAINVYSICCDEFNINRDIINNKINFTVNITSLSMGMNYLKNDNYFEFGCTLGELFFTHKKTNIGLEVDTIKWSVYYYQNVEKNVMITWLYNSDIYWNMIKNKNIVLSPFISMQYLLFTTEKMKLDFGEFLFKGGIRFTWMIGRIFLPPAIGFEIGYKNEIKENEIYLKLRLSWAL
jgi:hypothetical protein